MKLNTDLCEEIVSNLKLIYNKIESGKENDFCILSIIYYNTKIKKYN